MIRKLAVSMLAIVLLSSANCWAEATPSIDLGNLSLLRSISRSVYRIHVDHIPYWIDSALPVRPDTIADEAFVKCDVILTADQRAGLMDALGKTRTTTIKSKRSMYWGGIFYAVDGAKLFSIALSRPYNESATGWIDGELMELNTPLIDWFEHYFSESTMSATKCWVRPWVMDGPSEKRAPK